jgi:nicotinate-nucleotide pyrophosphorylase (carboxylating)
MHQTPKLLFHLLCKKSNQFKASILTLQRMFLPRRIIEDKLRQILADDVGHGDITVAAVIPPNLVTKAKVVAKENGVVAGVEEALILAEHLGLKAKAKVTDGETIQNEQVILQLNGDAQTILCVERTMLNLLSRMSGIATKTKTLTEKLQRT